MSDSADRNLLLGVIALQVDFIDRDALVDAMQAWIQSKDRSITQVLLEQGVLEGMRQEQQ